MITHYISYFCRENGRQREAVCGDWIVPRLHSAEPTCQACADWLLQEAESAEEMTAEEMFGADPHDYNR